jgi:hypothetical protein
MFLNPLHHSEPFGPKINLEKSLKQSSVKKVFFKILSLPRLPVLRRT